MRYIFPTSFYFPSVPSPSTRYSLNLPKLVAIYFLKNIQKLLNILVRVQAFALLDTLITSSFLLKNASAWSLVLNPKAKSTKFPDGY